MRTRTFAVFMISLLVCASFLVTAFADDPKPVQLPEPKLDSGKSLAQVLKERKTSRDYAIDNLPEQTLSSLLWAAFGINRPDSGRRTAPSAYNRQEIDVYVVTPSGAYVYDPKGNALAPIVPGDIRALTYTQAPFKDAPLHLVFIADLDKMGEGEEASKMLIAAMDTGFISENVYLYCASEGLNTGYRVSMDKPKLAEALKLRPAQRIVGAQSVGLPKGK
jgi:nitroreductase